MIHNIHYFSDCGIIAVEKCNENNSIDGVYLYDLNLCYLCTMKSDANKPLAESRNLKIILEHGHKSLIKYSSTKLKVSFGYHENTQGDFVRLYININANLDVIDVNKLLSIKQQNINTEIFLLNKLDFFFILNISNNEYI